MTEKRGRKLSGIETENQMQTIIKHTSPRETLTMLP